MPAATGALALALLRWQRDFPGAVPNTLATPPDHVACPRFLDDTAVSAEMVFGGDRNEYWDGVDIRDEIAATDVPVLVANGLQQEGHILQIEGLWDLLGGDRRMVLGQWNHQWPHTAGHKTWQQMMVDWFDHHLRGGPAKVASDVVDFQSDDGKWHQSARWPPPTTDPHLEAQWRLARCRRQGH